MCIRDSGWDAESEAVVVELLAITEGEFDESVVLDDTDEGPDAVRVFLTTQAAREFAARSSRVISAGRPPCPLCAEPLDPAGHLCVRTNGFKRDAELSKSIEFVDPEVFRDLSLGDDSGLYDTHDEGDESGEGPDADSPGRD